MTPQELEDTAYPGQFSVYDIEILVPCLKKLKAGDVYLEVGVDRGRSLSVADMVADYGVILEGVDINKTEELEDLLSKVERLIFYHEDSLELAKRYERKISVLFIDGNHSYDGCKADIEAWLPHMKKGGVVLFHDYDITSPGVIKAVDEWANANGLKVEAQEPVGHFSSVAKVQL